MHTLRLIYKYQKDKIVSGTLCPTSVIYGQPAKSDVFIIISQNIVIFYHDEALTPVKIDYILLFYNF